MSEPKDKKTPNEVTKANLATINRGKNLRPSGKATTAIVNDIHESTIDNMEDQYSNRKYNLKTINRLAKGNKQKILDYLPEKPYRSNTLHQKITISSVISFGGTKAFRALILNGYLDNPRTLEDIKAYSTILFCREYNLSDFGKEKLILLQSGILIEGDGKEFPENTFILAKGKVVDWEF